MKFFNIDQHISVIADIKHIFRNMGHEVDDWCLSGHGFVFGRRADTDKIPELAGDSWCSVSNEDRWQQVYDKYAPQWEQYDGFIVTYPPVFARLFIPSGKPVIVHIPIRFDYGVHDKPELLEKLIDDLKKPNVILLANSKFDKYYAERFIGDKVQHIPSLCEYTNVKRQPDNWKYINWLLHESGGGYSIDRTLFVNKHKALPAGYTWDKIIDFCGSIHIPYQVSTMSIFEQYTMGMPLMFPTKRLMLELYRQGHALQHFTHYKLWNTPPGSIKINRNVFDFDGMVPDPNRYDDIDAVAHWLDFADYYDTALMPHIEYFDSWQEANSKALGLDVERISHLMHIQNDKRRMFAYSAWRNVIQTAKKLKEAA